MDLAAILTSQCLASLEMLKLTDYLKQEFPSSLQAFTAQRADLLAVLTPVARCNRHSDR